MMVNINGKQTDIANWKPWPSRNIVDLPSYKMVILTVDLCKRLPVGNITCYFQW